MNLDLFYLTALFRNAENIIALRTALGMSQQAFADAIGTSKISVGGWETYGRGRGRCLPSESSVKKIVAKLKVRLLSLDDTLISAQVGDNYVTVQLPNGFTQTA